MNSRIRTCAAISLCVLALGHARAQQNVPAYNTYQAAPFVVEGKAALAADLVGYLNDKLKGKATLELKNMPRERLNRTVINDPNFKGVVLFLNPAFVGDADRKKYAWTGMIMADGNDVISPIRKKVEYQGPDSLKGMNFQGILGHKYAGLEERFGKDIQRFDVGNELQILKILASGRADVTVMANSMFTYLLKTHGASDGLDGKLHVSSTQHLKFDRFIFTAGGNSALFQDIAVVAKSMPTDPAWKAILAKYGLT